MAPVGSFGSLMAAIQGGADSIYFGIEQLNMRARSSYNFTMDDMLKITSICKEHDIQTYLTVNTIMYDKDLDFMKNVIRKAKEQKIGAVIASDQSAIQYAHSVDIPVHISTQLSISNIETIKFYSGYADVMVLARELDLEQVSAITKTIREENIKGPGGGLVAIELFAHGALCMAISGKCYLSLHEQNYSANRGECMQTCRKSYLVTEKESGYELEIDNEYIMSPKDLCTINFINKILDAGVKILKIEGRARPPEYVYTVTKCYDEAVKAYIDGSYGEEKIKNWRQSLSSVFNRGFWDGYYLGQKIGAWSHRYGSRATKRKIYIGKAINYFTKIKVAEFKIETGTLKAGDDILITGPTTGVVYSHIKEIRVDRKPVNKATKGEYFSIAIENQVRRSDKLFKVVDSKEVKQQ
ncbi:MAG: U32 family peptidase [Bacteroidetes bacterium]|nr:U32 family peptidase [Bacteroidota bacterium]